MIELRPWMLPLIVAGIVAPAGLGLILLGPQGMMFGAFATAFAIVLVVARPWRGRPIEIAPGDGGHHVLIAVAEAIDAPRLAGRIAGHVGDAGGDGDGDADVLVVSPALNPTLHHWAADVGEARARAAARLETSLHSLERAGVGARGSVGDSNPMLAIEDALREFPADEIVVVGGEEIATRLAGELRQRLDRPVEALALVPDAGGGRFL